MVRSRSSARGTVRRSGSRSTRRRSGRPRAGQQGGHEDRVDISLAVAGGKPIAIVVYPGNAIAREKILAPAKD